MALTVTEAFSVQSPNGNSLAVFIEAQSGEIKLKDVNGKVEALTDYISGSPYRYNADYPNAIQPILGNNQSVGNWSWIGGGRFNTANGSSFATVGGGYSNIASACASAIVGGVGNIASGVFSSILGGRFNNTCTCACTMIVGSNITANRACATFVNNLSIMNIPTSNAGLPSGSVYRVGSALCIVP
jgi:hypothetical protein